MTSVRVNTLLLDYAKEMDINMSRLLEDALKEKMSKLDIKILACKLCHTRATRSSWKLWNWTCPKCGGKYMGEDNEMDEADYDDEE